MALSSIVDHLSPESYKKYKLRIVLFNLIKRAGILGAIFSLTLISNPLLFVFSLIVSIVAYLTFTRFEDKVFNLMVGDVFDHMTRKKKVESQTDISDWKALIKKVALWQMDRFPTRDLGECLVILVVMALGFSPEYLVLSLTALICSFYREVRFPNPSGGNPRSNPWIPILIFYGANLLINVVLGFGLPTRIEFLFTFSIVTRIFVSVGDFFEKHDQYRKADSALITNLEAIQIEITAFSALPARLEPTEVIGLSRSGIADLTSSSNPIIRG